MTVDIIDETQENSSESSKKKCQYDYETLTSNITYLEVIVTEALSDWTSQI